MKTILAILALALAAATAPAQSPPAETPADTPAADDVIRAALEKAYAQADGQAPTPPPRATPLRVRRTGGDTNAPVLVNPPTSLPKSDTPPPAVGAAPVTKLTTSAPPAFATSAPPVTAAADATNLQPVPAITNAPAPTVTATPPPPVPAPAEAAVPPAASAPRTSAVPASASSPTNRGAVNVFAADRTNRAQRTVPGLPIPSAPGPRAPGAGTAGAGAGQPAAVTPAGQPAVPGAADAVAAREEEVFPPGLIKFSDADIGQVLEIYQELTGRTVLKPNSLPAVKVTIRSQTQLTRSEAIHALDSILSLNGVAMVPQGDKFVKALAEAQGAQAAQRFNELPHDSLPEAGSLVTHVVQLKNAIPTEIQPALQAFAKLPNSILAINSTSMLVLRDYAENVKRMLEMLEQIDIIPPQDFVDVVIPIRYALAGDIAQVLSSLTAGGGGATTVGRGTTRTGLSTGGGGGALGTAGSLPGQPGYNPSQAAQQQQAGLTTGGIGGAAAQRSSFADRLRSIVNRAGSSGTGDIFVLGQTKIIADERTNSLLIFASKQDLGTISNIIDKLDVVLAQVIIEGIFMEVALGDDLDYGVSLLQTKQSATGKFAGIGASRNGQFLTPGNFGSLGSNSLGSGLSYFAKFDDDLEASFTAIANDRSVNVLARPRIQTSHAVEANLFVGETRPYITGTYNYFGSTGGSSSYSQLQIGLTLSVLPLINADGLVVMDIRQKIQQIGEFVTIDNNEVPATIDREANAKVAVRDREVILLGGMITQEARKSKSGVPLLKDIPGLGVLFRSTSKENQRRELIVLIRPTVLPTPQEAAIVASEERALLPATAEYERDVRREERNRIEDYNSRVYKREGFRK